MAQDRARPTRARTTKKAAEKTAAAKPRATRARRTRATTTEASPEAVATLAYLMWERGEPGDATEHWLRAEADLRAA
jgi:hypothetical protein